MMATQSKPQTVQEACPRLEIHLDKIRHNTRCLAQRLAADNMALMAVTKVVLGEPAVARMMMEGGARYIGDSRIENIRRMAQAGVNAEFALIRSPQISRVDEVVAHAHMSCNSELSVVQALSDACQRLDRTHKVLIMVELGDLREGLLPRDLMATVASMADLPGITVAGIGTNLGCFSGTLPGPETMDQLSALADQVEAQLGLTLDLVSGGNSSNYSWLTSASPKGRINNLRMGEMIFLGRNIMTNEPVPEMHQDAVRLVGEVIEFKTKSSAPQGDVVRDAFGEKPKFANKGQMTRAILALGRQDVFAAGIVPPAPMEIVGACSDHLVLDTCDIPVKIGDELGFDLSYGALLSAMTSPYVKKVYF